MIKSVDIKNFQSHKDTRVEFDAGVNALVGQSDSGKTAVLRAVLWVVTNEPSGEEYRSNWGGDTVVRLGLDDGVVVERGRTNNDNYYALERPGEKREEYRAFGIGRGGIPQDIGATLNFFLQPSDSDLPEFNIGFQMDRPFLLSSGSGDVAKMLNKAVNLEVIDTSISNARKKKLEAERQLRSAEENLGSLQKQLTEFGYLDAMEADVVKLEGLQLRIQDVTTRTSNLRTRVDKIKAVQQDQQKHLALLAAKPTLDAAIDCRDKQSLCREKITRLSGLVRQLRTTERRYETATRLSSARPLVDSLDRVMADRFNCQTKIDKLRSTGFKMVETRERCVNAENLVNAAATIEACITVVAKRKELKEKIRALDGCMTNIHNAEVRFGKINTQYKKLSADFTEEMGDTCGLCGSALNVMASAPISTTRRR